MPSVTIHPPKTPVTRGSSGIAKATLPNVCKMPGPPAPFVPTPLPNIARSGSSPKGYSKRVTMEGKAVAIRGASFKSVGDAASKATGGGMISANTHGPAKFLTPGSLTVKIEGKNVHLLGDPMLNNCGPSGNPPNSATLQGLDQKDGKSEKVDWNCVHCGKSINDPSHNIARLATDNRSLMKSAAQQPISNRTKGGIQVGDKPPIFDGSGLSSSGKPLVPSNLASGKPLKIPAAYVERWKAAKPKGFEPGNCVEQKLLAQAFPKPGDYPPKAGPIKMGIAQLDNQGKHKHKVKCATCEELMIAMLCTNKT